MAPSMAPKGASSAAISEGIQVRGPYQCRAQLRRNGVYQSKTFETLREAQEWRRIVEGKVTGNEFIDLRRARMTALTQACDRTLDRKLYGNRPDAKNVAAKLRYRKTSKFADWSLISLRVWGRITCGCAASRRRRSRRRVESPDRGTGS